MKYTPAPWNITWGSAQGGEGHHIMDSSGVDSSLSMIAVVTFHDDSEGETKANAKLISAAPELLEALQGLVAASERIETKTTSQVIAINRAIAAIAKATGSAA